MMKLRPQRLVSPFSQSSLLRQVRQIAPITLGPDELISRKKLGVLENSERSSPLCVPQSADFGARRFSMERGRERVYEEIGRGLTLRWMT